MRASRKETRHGASAAALNNSAGAKRRLRTDKWECFSNEDLGQAIQDSSSLTTMALEGQEEEPCLWNTDLVPLGRHGLSNAPQWAWHTTSPLPLETQRWVLASDGSGGRHSHDPRLRRLFS